MTLRQILNPITIEAAGSIPKTISEYVGLVATGTESVSVALMRSPSGWSEPGQTPEFDEYTVVLEGDLLVESRTETVTVHAGQAVQSPGGEWVRYSTPNGASYVAVCVPAFSPETVHRDG